MIFPCDCNHPAQDKLHGKGMRAHNPRKGGTMGYRCAACGDTKDQQGKRFGGKYR